MTSQLPDSVTAIVIEDDNLLSIEAVCRSLSAEEPFIIELITHDIIQPRRMNEAWYFDSFTFRRTKLAVSFYHDLGINIEGIAMAIDLIERLESEGN